LNDFSSYDNDKIEDQKIYSNTQEKKSDIDKSSQLTTDVSDEKIKSIPSIDQCSTDKNTPLKLNINLSDDFKEVSTDEKSSNYKIENNSLLNKKRKYTNDTTENEQDEEIIENMINMKNVLTNNRNFIFNCDKSESQNKPVRKIDSLNSKSTMDTLNNQSIEKSTKNNNEILKECSKVVKINFIKDSSKNSEDNLVLNDNKFEFSKKLPVKEVVENKEKVEPNLQKLILTEKLKRDFFGLNCKFTLEQMLHIIKVRKEHEKKLKQENLTKSEVVKEEHSKI
jgi:hypothetical protein